MSIKQTSAVKCFERPYYILFVYSNYMSLHFNRETPTNGFWSISLLPVVFGRSPDFDTHAYAHHED